MECVEEVMMEVMVGDGVKLGNGTWVYMGGTRCSVKR